LSGADLVLARSLHSVSDLTAKSLSKDSASNGGSGALRTPGRRQAQDNKQINGLEWM